MTRQDDPGPAEAADHPPAPPETTLTGATAAGARPPPLPGRCAANPRGRQPRHPLRPTPRIA